MPPLKLRRSWTMLAFLLLPACSGDSTGAGGLSVQLSLPNTVLGEWAGFTSVLTCRPEMTVTAKGTGKAVWTGGTSKLTADYGTYDLTHTAEEVAFMVGTPQISAGQTLTVLLPRSGYASFHIEVHFNYTVEGTGQTGTASGGYDCKAPASV